MGFLSDLVSDVVSPISSYFNSGSDTAAATTAENQRVAAEAEALNRERYGEAVDRLDPYMSSELAANQQLMIEMGLAPSGSERLRRLEAELAQLTSEEAAQFAASNATGQIASSISGRDFQPQDQTANPRIQELAGLIEDERSAINSAGGGSPGTAYMENPGYHTAMNEALRGAETASAAQGSAYGGRAQEAAARAGVGVQQSYYNNYMNTLTQMASPQVTQNLSSLGVGQGATIGAQNLQSTQANGVALQQGESADRAVIGDGIGAALGYFL